MFLKIIFLLCSKLLYKLITNPNTLNKDNINYRIVKINKNDKRYSGYDDRYPIQTATNNTEISNIINFFDKKKILDVLTNDKVCLYTKMELIRDNTISPYSLFAGGLMKHFDFEDF
jgi:hypothetical protein